MALSPDHSHAPVQRRYRAAAAHYLAGRPGYGLWSFEDVTARAGLAAMPGGALALGLGRQPLHQPVVQLVAVAGGGLRSLIGVARFVGHGATEPKSAKPDGS